jgi:hypothetical protein
MWAGGLLDISRSDRHIKSTIERIEQYCGISNVELTNGNNQSRLMGIATILFTIVCTGPCLVLPLLTSSNYS